MRRVLRSLARATALLATASAVSFVAIIAWRSAHVPQPGSFASAYEPTLDDPRLNRKVGGFTVEKVPCADVVAAFSEHVGLPIDASDLEATAVAFGRSTPMTFTLHAGTVREQLDALCLELNAQTFLLEDGRVRLIADLQDALQNRLYDIGPLVDALLRRRENFTATFSRDERKNESESLVWTVGGDEDAAAEFVFNALPERHPWYYDSQLGMSLHHRRIATGLSRLDDQRRIAECLDKLWRALEAGKTSEHFTEPSLEELPAKSHIE